MRSTLDAAILSKTARARPDQRGDRRWPPHGQRRRLEAERIASLVAAQANILIVPNIEAGNLLAEELTFIARPAAGLVVGAKMPVVLTSRARGVVLRA
jgi:phosphate acetyltransferase